MYVIGVRTNVAKAYRDSLVYLSYRRVSIAHFPRPEGDAGNGMPCEAALVCG